MVIRYKMGTARLKRQKIILPINKNKQPDYEFMENYMKNIEYKKLTEYMKFKNEWSMQKRISVGNDTIKTKKNSVQHHKLK